MKNNLIKLSIVSSVLLSFSGCATNELKVKIENQNQKLIKKDIKINNLKKEIYKSTEEHKKLIQLSKENKSLKEKLNKIKNNEEIEKIKDKLYKLIKYVEEKENIINEEKLKNKDITSLQLKVIKQQEKDIKDIKKKLIENKDTILTLNENISKLENHKKEIQENKLEIEINLNKAEKEKNKIIEEKLKMEENLKNILEQEKEKNYQNLKKISLENESILEKKKELEENLEKLKNHKKEKEYFNKKGEKIKIEDVLEKNRQLIILINTAFENLNKYQKELDSKQSRQLKPIHLNIDNNKKFIQYDEKKIQEIIEKEKLRKIRLKEERNSKLIPLKEK